MRQISGKVISKGKKWFKVELDNIDNCCENFLLIEEQTKSLQVSQNFSIQVRTKCKQFENAKKYFHIPIQEKDTIVVGFGVDHLIIQPCKGNIFVRGEKVYRVIKVRKNNDGWAYGYSSDDWWECLCEDITNTKRGKEAINEQVERLDL